MADIDFFVLLEGERVNIKDEGYHLGFFGYGGRFSHVEIGEWQDNVYLVDVDERGLVQLPWNTKYYHDASGYLNDISTPLDLSNIPNYQSTINIRFSADSSVRIMDAQVKLYDGVDEDNPPIGVRAKIAEIYHPGRVQVVNVTHRGDWYSAGSGQSVPLWRGPGEDGVNAGHNTYHRATIHDWYLCLSVSPQEEEIVQRNFGSLLFSVEYL